MSWDFIRRRFKPSTKVGASKLKGKIKKVKLTDFKDDVIKFNTWIKNTKRVIIAEEGEGEGYNKYIRMLFQSYLSSNNTNFRIVIQEEEERKWIQYKLKSDYSLTDLLGLGMVTFNNLVKNKSWVTAKYTGTTSLRWQ